MRKMTCLTIWLLPVVLCAQVTVRPPAGRGTVQAEPNPKEACSIEGSVLDASTGESVRNADVTLQPASGASQSTRTSYSASTDAKGRFAIQGIVPGSYRLTARCAGFLQTEHGARDSGRQATLLALAAGQSITDVVLRLTRGGVIAGKVLDELGDPIGRASVSALRCRYISGGRQLVEAHRATADDQGNYRLLGLEPGRYLLRVTYGTASPAASSQAGSQPGLSYVPVYYPGITDESVASLIVLAAGGQLSGVDVVLVKSASYRVIAEVQSRAPISGLITAVIRPRTGVLMPASFRTVTLPQKATKLDVQGVTPGSYVLMVGTTEQRRPLQGSIPFEVVDRNVTDLVVSLQAGYEIPGEVRLEDAAPVDLGALSVVATGALTFSAGMAGNPMVAFGTTSVSNVGEDRKFTLSNVFSDASRLTVTGLPQGFYLKSILFGNDEVLETGLDLSSGPKGSLRITLSGKAGAVSGSVTDADGKAVDNATVVLIPKSERRRGKVQFYRAVTADQKGQFTITGVDPGDYTAYSWEYMDAQSYLDPEVVNPVENKGLAVTVDPGGQHQVQLQALPASP